MFSGGPDSTTLLYDLVNQGCHVHALYFDFGENSTRSVHQILSKVGDNVSLHHFRFSDFMNEFYGLPQPILMRRGFIMNEIPETAEYVQPFGSAISLMLAASWSIKNNIRDVFYGIHYNDTHFTDNKAEYFAMLSSLTELCEGPNYRVQFHTPYLDMPKAQVVQKGAELGIDFADTWSCAAHGEVHCGACPPCLDRQMAFTLAQIVDPVAYAGDVVQVR
ncbi:7-cyano-7-deazaguanine synthase [Arcanobacterium wilhelmae]|uniref:7-cyano-7-deazaguanine synthase n=1 Tax=Arcanobacterium wilhelmae TaxID=1803177 RepID=A0ABT9NA65_9ACTO|nr:7-cyano-7-deazaguanine synthase [Arcanobacterium wilhelmae]MDP9800582.1 7-cyano-7-deazaguanine synthase [Arcanobacterium wilhelmae]